MLENIDAQAVKSGFDLLKGAIDTVKSLRDMLPAKGLPSEDLTKKIELAERQLALGEAQIAQALGYKLCRAHFPPVPMLKDRVNPTYVEDIHKCPVCGFEEPSPEYFAKQEATDRAFETHNANLPDDWMGV